MIGADSLYSAEQEGGGGTDENYLTKQQIHETLTKCYLLTGIAKLKGINQYISDITENECKFLIFAHHMEVLDGIEEELKKLKLKYIRIDGSTPMNKRHDLVQQFQEVPILRIALLSISATGVGLTLTAASTILFAEMHWTPAIMLQAEDRAHRIGQINSVNCHYLYGSGTLDDKLYQKLDRKLCIVTEMIDGARKDLEVDDHIKKGEKGAVSQHRPKENTQKVKRNSSIFVQDDEFNSVHKEKITDFFQIVGTRSSDPIMCSEEKKLLDLTKNEKKDDKLNSFVKSIDTNHSGEKKTLTLSGDGKYDDEIASISELPDLDLVDKLVEEHKSSLKKNKKKEVSIEGFRKAFEEKEYKNNLILGEEFYIDDYENFSEPYFLVEDNENNQKIEKENFIPKIKSPSNEKIKRSQNKRLDSTLGPKENKIKE